LSSKAKAGALLVLDAATLEAPKTAALRANFAALGVKNALVIAGPEVDSAFGLAARNIPNVDVLPNAGLNVYDILRRDTLVLTKAAIEGVVGRFAENDVVVEKAPAARKRAAPKAKVAPAAEGEAA
jgi:large subunit ribosomal protein L4